jgi:KUP system potassium uptake protein
MPHDVVSVPAPDRLASAKSRTASERARVVPLSLVSIKYVGIVLRADNDGEGGILALLALAFPEKNRKSGLSAAGIMTALGVFGAALLYGEGVITPAISVLSAVEGINTVSPLLDKMVVPLTISILVALFSIQRFGTSAVGGMFGKVMLVWFLVLGATGFLQPVQGSLSISSG